MAAVMGLFVVLNTSWLLLDVAECSWQSDWRADSSNSCLLGWALGAEIIGVRAGCSTGRV